MDISEALDLGIRKLEEKGKAVWEKDDADGKWHVSDITACRRQVQLRRRKIKPTNQKPIDSILVMETGKVYHEVLQLALKEAGVLVRADWKDDPFSITDGDARGHPDILCLLDTGRGLEVWDVKSKPGWKFGKGKEIAPSEEEVLQLHGYMGPMHVKFGGFIFVNRDSGKYYPVRCDFEEKYYLQSQHLLDQLVKDDKTETLPERLEPDNWRCRYKTREGADVCCQFFSYCWPEEETVTRVSQ